MSWNGTMMCDVMPTISEDGVDHPQGSVDGGEMGSDQNRIEQLMVNMLDERDKLLEQLQEAQRRIDDLTQHLKDAERDKESLRRQFDLQTQHLPAVDCGEGLAEAITVVADCDLWQWEVNGAGRELNLGLSLTWRGLWSLNYCRNPKCFLKTSGYPVILSTTRGHNQYR
ncbi:Liprin-alpha [Toxocara canis]|uniref:Liprin-alpha n=1 Tax=Toxocara canis TaxID=6265 RepID=A0A0B2VXQ2_TOXCA|nr:Liprin-alpha [Toxocara canis]